MPQKITIGIYAHANAGKTTVTEQLLKNAGVIENVGRVDYGNTVTDNLKVEKERGITVRSSLVSFSSGKNDFNLIDTPGHIDFVAEVERSMSVLDCAVLVISGAEGVEAQTFSLYKSLAENKIPTIIFVNKLDRRGASLSKVKEDILNELKGNFVFVNEYDNNEVKQLSERDLISQLAEYDERSLDVFINNKLDSFDTQKRLLNLFGKSKVIPVFCGSALNGIGVEKVFDFLSQINIERQDEQELSALVYQVRVDEGIRNAYIKLFGGEISKRQSIQIGENTFKIKDILVANGGKLVETDKISQGDVAIIRGLELESGQVIGKPPAGVKLNFHKPLYSVEVCVKKGDLENAVRALKILTIEDPYLNFQYNSKTSQLKINVMGQVQAEIVKQFMLERFKTEVELKDFGVIYKETPKKEATGKASYTGCSEVEFRVAPRGRSSGLVFSNEIAQDTIHPKYIKQIERLVDFYKENSLHGWELTDCEVALISARSDSVVSEPMHFNIATPIALFRALKQAETILLEPYNKYAVVSKSEHLKNIVSLLSTLSAPANSVKYDDNVAIVRGTCSVLNSSKIIKVLPTITGGLGKALFDFLDYRPTEVMKENPIMGFDPRKEIEFIQNQLGQTFKLLDKQPTRAHKVKYSQRKYEEGEL